MFMTTTFYNALLDWELAFVRRVVKIYIYNRFVGARIDVIHVS